MKKKLLLVLFCLLSHVSYSQKYIIHDKKERLKINLFDFSYWHLISIKGSYEYQINDRLFLEPELGYTFYSIEDNIPVKGLLAGASINKYKFVEGRHPSFIKFNPYYHKIYLMNYLKYDASLPNFGEYADYKLTRFTKNRFGFNFQLGRQYAINDHLFLELSFGLGLEYFNTIVPEAVTQKHFKNGNLDNKMGIRPIVLTAIKLGWAL